MVCSELRTCLILHHPASFYSILRVTCHFCLSKLFSIYSSLILAIKSCDQTSLLFLILWLMSIKSQISWSSPPLNPAIGDNWSNIFLLGSKCGIARIHGICVLTWLLLFSFYLTQWLHPHCNDCSHITMIAPSYHDCSISSKTLTGSFMLIECNATQVI